MIVYRKPVIFYIIKRFYPIDWETVIITFGKNIYVKYPIATHLERHEEVHLKQQKYSSIYAIYWWIKYLYNPDFRYTQELEAYRAQYKYFCSTTKDREARSRFLAEISGHLSSDMYGEMVTKYQAAKDICA